MLSQLCVFHRNKAESKRLQSFSLLSPHQMTKLLNTFGEQQLCEYSIHYLKKTDSSILYVLRRERCGGKNGPGWSLGPCAVSSWLWLRTALLPVSVRVRVLMTLKSKVVIHHYLNKHLLHAHFKFLSTFVLFLQWLEQLSAEKSFPSTQSRWAAHQSVAPAQKAPFASAAIPHGCCVNIPDHL